MSSVKRLASGLEQRQLGLHLEGNLARLPVRRVAIELDDADRLAASLPSGVARPRDGWRGNVALAPAWIAVSYGALSLNSQIVPLLQAAEASGAESLAVLAPLVTDEALATLLVNDAARTLRGRIVALELDVPEPHAGEVGEAIAAWLRTSAWDGRPNSAGLARVARLAVHRAGAEVWRAPGHLPLVDRLFRVLGRR